MVMRRGFLFALLLLLAPVAQAAISPNLYAGLHWRLLGPFRGGRVLAVSGVPGHPERYYFGAVDGGVWRSDDAGRTWKPISDALPVGSIGALAVAPSNPQVLYVGTGEADMRSDIAQGDGMWKSVDGGQHWTHIGLQHTRAIGSILVDPRNAKVVWVAALGHPYGPNVQRGVFKSVNGGKTWTKVLYHNPNTGAIDLAFQPGNPDVVYAALWQTRRPPWNVYPPANGPGSGLYKTRDGGKTWTHIEGHGFPADPGRIGIAVAPSRPQRVYAMVSAQQGGLYRSDDGGVHWTQVSKDVRIWKRGWYFGGITVAPHHANVIYANNTVLYESRDGGRHFVPVKGDFTGDDYHVLWINPRHPRFRILGVDQGAVVSVDGGRHWSSWYNQPTAQIYHVSTDHRFPFWVYGAQQDSGAVALPSRTLGMNGVTMMQFHEITAGGESDEIAPDPGHPNIIYGGRVERLNRHTGQTRSIPPTLAFPAHYRGTWTLPLTFSRRGPKTLYFANQRLFATTDGGLHWRPISPDLTRKHPSVPANVGTITASDSPVKGPRRGVIYSIAPSPKDAGLIWVGTDDGLIWKTRDGGAHWHNVTPAGLKPWSKVGNIEASPFASRVAYASIDRHRLDDDHPYIYRTTDGGRHWQKIVAGLPVNQSVNVVREDPKVPGLLYAGTQRSVFVSFNNGAHWQVLKLNLPATSVRDITVHGEDLVIATHGRGFWILDDIEPLRQAMAAGTTSGPYLEQPAVAFRTRPQGFAGTPLPFSEPRGKNPPNGAYIDYVLKHPAQTVTLTIRNAAGQPVRRFSSRQQPTKPDLATMQMTPRWFVSKPSLKTTSGMHRLVWNFRYAVPAALARGGPWGNGVWAPPGTYHITLKVDGIRLQRTLPLRADPRVHIAAKAYVEQFALARAIEADRVAIARVRKQAKGLRGVLQQAQKTASGKQSAALVRLTRQLRALANFVPDNPRNSVGSPAPNLDSLRALARRMSKLQQAVDGADAAPSVDTRTGYAKDQATWQVTYQRWQHLQQEVQALLGTHTEAGPAAR